MWVESNKILLKGTKIQTTFGWQKKLKDIKTFDPQNLQIVIDQEPVSKIKRTKYLGIKVDHFLEWDEHMSALIKKISRGKGMQRYGKDIFL